MRFKTNNIDKHLDIVESVLDLSMPLSRELVISIRNKISRPPTVFYTWGDSRRARYLEHNYFYTALNILKVFKLNNVSTKAGIVYFLEHPAFPGCIKVGRTQDIDDRLSQYNVGCPYKNYKVRYYTIVTDAICAENLLHECLDGRLCGEWFSDTGLEKRSQCAALIADKLPELQVIKN